MFKQITILGVGMIGASFGYACRHKGIAKQVVGFGRSEENLQDAVKVGAIDRYSTELEEAVKEADFVFVAVGLDAIVPLVKSCLKICKPGTIITDAGSTKEEILNQLSACSNHHLSLGAVFVGAHPIAGSEKQGAINFVSALYEGAYTIITPFSEEKQEKCATGIVALLWKRLGSRVVFMNAKEHDHLLGLISHLPHLVAYSLVNCVEELPQCKIDIAAGGFRDFTRIASSDPELWASISFSNKNALIEMLEDFERKIAEIRKRLQEDNREELAGLLQKAQAIRTGRFQPRTIGKAAQYTPVITIDGPAGAGKSTIAKMIAERLNMTYLDTGAIYRSLALFALQEGLDLNDGEKLVALLNKMQLEFHFHHGINHVSLNGDEVTEEIRTSEVSLASSKVSALEVVRKGLLGFQRGFIRDGSMVCEGRDTGSVVFPSALYKFYLDADLSERGKRRFAEMKEKSSQDVSEVTDQLSKRDAQDSKREVSPLIIPPDAIYIDTTSLSLDEVFSFMLKYIASDSELE